MRLRRPDTLGKGTPIHPWRWRALTAWIIIFSILVGLALRNGRQQDAEIQRQRADSIERNCNVTNGRHDAAITELNRIFAHALRDEADPRRIEQLRLSRRNSTLLINALSPRQDCAKLVRLGLRR